MASAVMGQKGNTARRGRLGPVQKEGARELQGDDGEKKRGAKVLPVDLSGANKQQKANNCFLGRRANPASKKEQPAASPKDEAPCHPAHWSILVVLN
eukprot:6173349-Pleurochrysis_carterae.AAC.8